MKATLKRFARMLGLQLSSADKLGADVYVDLARFTAEVPLRTIFDVGANIGQTSLRLSDDFPAATLYAFEPEETSFAQLAEVARSSPRIVPFHSALGPVCGTLPLYRNRQPGRSSLLPRDETVAQVEVTVQTLDGFCASHAVASIDLLKLDVEGFELNVLEGAAGLLARGSIRFVLAECVFAPNMEMPQVSFFALHERLTQLGFCFVGFYAESYYLHLGCALGNVLYALQAKLPAAVPGKVRNIV